MFKKKKSNFVRTDLNVQSWLYASWWWNYFCRFVGGM